MSTTSGLIRNYYELLTSLANALGVPGILWSKDLWTPGYVIVSVLEKGLRHVRISSPLLGLPTAAATSKPPITSEGEECVWLIASQQ